MTLTTAKSRIQITFMGGLGNQLFQYSFGLYLTKHFNLKVLYSDFGLSVKGNTERRYMLGDLVAVRLKKASTQLQIVLIRLFSYLFPSLIIFESGPLDSPETRIRKSSKLLFGYFQNYRFADAVKAELLSEFKKSELFAAVIPKSPKDEIAVHMRYGDYAKNETTKQTHGLTATSYYVYAVQLLLKSEKSYKKIVIYSDEPEHALAEFTEAFGKFEIPIVASEFSSEYDDLREMASSSGIVISNSSFSWWAARIGSNCIGSTVIAPIPWLANASAYDEKLIPSNWVVIERELQS
jgi:hypothetical protein